jgi:hypothetical protein
MPYGPLVLSLLSLAAIVGGDVRTIDNGRIRLGVDLARGGAITELSESSSGANLVNNHSGANLVNNHDLGRQIQMSFYADPRPYVENGKAPEAHWAHLGWNPIQSGDAYGNGSRVLEFSQTATSLFVKCVPLQWPLERAPADCTFEMWVDLEANRARLRCRLTNARRDHNRYPARHQELPAVYTNGSYHRLVTYAGPRPFTGEPVETIPQMPTGGFPWTYWLGTEGWAALVDESGHGLGIHSPETIHFVGGFSGTPGAGGTQDPQTGYVAPLLDEILDHDITYEYRATLIVGSLDEIRRHAVAEAPRPGLPDWRFSRDRQHWSLTGGSFESGRWTSDDGWPIDGELTFAATLADAAAVSPLVLWRAEQAPRVSLTAAFEGPVEQMEIAWARYERARPGPRFAPGQACVVPVVADGRCRTIDVELAASPAYRGALTALRVRPVVGDDIPGKEGIRVKLRRVWLHGLPQQREQDRQDDEIADEAAGKGETGEDAE